MSQIKLLFMAILLLYVSQMFNVLPVYNNFTDIRTRFNEKHFANVSIYAKNSKLYLDAYIIHALKSGLHAYADCQLRNTAKMKYQRLIAFNFDFCNIFKTSKNTLTKTFLKSVFKSSNIIEGCPIAKGRYYIDGWRLDAAIIPPFLYRGDYRIKVCIFYGKEKCSDNDFVLKVDVDTTLEDL